jgi:hypothetical protein
MEENNISLTYVCLKISNCPRSPREIDIFNGCYGKSDFFQSFFDFTDITNSFFELRYIFIFIIADKKRNSSPNKLFM